MPHSTETISLDALIVGAGFGGTYQLKRLRDEGYNVKLVDAAADYAGVWYWNRYPGARVDSDVPYYEFSDPALWKEWTWSQRFPGGQELRDYFSFVAEKWDLRRDTEFNTYISKAEWKEDTNSWVVESSDGRVYHVRYLLLNIGFAARKYTPDWNGIEKFRGTWIHPSAWPKEEPDLSGRRVAIIGTGATGIQISQEVSTVAGHLTIFQKTPATALPRKQINWDKRQREFSDEQCKAVYDARPSSFGGFDYNFLPRNCLDDTPEQRQAVYESLWEKGDFHFWLVTYQDTLFNEEANREAYDFWKTKVRARIHDERMREILAQDKQRYSFGCKRVPLENGFYDIFNQPNVSLVDINETPIEEITESGIKTTEKEWEFDYIICATGFDAMTGGLLDIDIRGVNGQTLGGKWQTGVKTYLGMCVAGFPNMLFTYGPQAPTALCNGPTCAEKQGDFVVDAMNYMKKEGLVKMDAKDDAEEQWGEDVRKFANISLIPGTKSWYMGDNIPGKSRECLIYLGGVPNYYKTLRATLETQLNGFVTK